MLTKNTTSKSNELYQRKELLQESLDDLYNAGLGGSARGRDSYTLNFWKKTYIMLFWATS